jgi:anti-sigma B factor antagonist
MTFDYQIKNESGYDIVYLKGNLMEKSEAQAMMNELSELIAQGHKNFLLHLKDLKYMNSSGISTMIAILTKARNAGGEVVITGLSAKIKQLLIITKLNSVFKITESIKEAAHILIKN